MPQPSGNRKFPREKAAPAPPAEPRRMPAWIMVLLVGVVSAAAAVVAAAVVIAVMFAVVDVPSPKKQDPIAERKPVEIPVEPEPKDKPVIENPPIEKPPIEKPKEVVPPVKVDKNPVFNVEPAEGFVSLFNSKDLTGWQPHAQQPGDWRVEDGILQGKSVGGGFLFTKRGDFKDFHLRLEARLKPGKSSGVMFRYALDYLGYEAMISEKFTGVMSVRTRSGPGNTRALMNTGKPTQEPLAEWISMEILAEGNRLRVKINGVTTTDFEDAKNGFRQGHIGLRDFDGAIEFRRIEIKELPPIFVAVPPPAPAAGAAPFPADAAFVPLFNGKDLTGWKSSKPGPGNWRVDGGVLIGAGPNMGDLYTPRDDYADFHLRLEARINDAGQTNIAFRYPYDPEQLDKIKSGGYTTRINGRPNQFVKTGTFMVFEQVGARNLIAKEELMIAGQWFNFEIIAIGNQITTRINGRDAVNFTNPKTHLNTGRIVLGFSDTNAPVLVEYRKIEIKTIKSVALPAAPPPPRPLEEFVPLFNGKDLTGWTAQGNDAWKVTPGGELEGKGLGASLISKRTDYRNFIARIELSASDDVEAYFVFRQIHEQGKPVGLTSRITGDGNIVRAGGAGINGDKFESMPFQVKHMPFEPIVLEVHVMQDGLQIKHGRSTVGSLNYPPGRHPPGAIALHILKGTVRLKRFEISAEPPLVLPPPQIKLRIEDGGR